MSQITKLRLLLRSSYPTILIVWSIVIGLPILWEHYRVQINTTASMSQTLWFVKMGQKTLNTGDYLTARVHDSRAPDGVYENVVKQIGGVSGDAVQVKQTATTTTLTVNGNEYLVHKVLSGFLVTPLTESDITIPNGCYFVHGQSNPTFDSRYKEFGFICESQIYGKAYPIL